MCAQHRPLSRIPLLGGSRSAPPSTALQSPPMPSAAHPHGGPLGPSRMVAPDPIQGLQSTTPAPDPSVKQPHPLIRAIQSCLSSILQPKPSETLPSEPQQAQQTLHSISLIPAQHKPSVSTQADPFASYSDTPFHHKQTKVINAAAT